MKTAGTSVTTWGNGTDNQTSPAYCGVQEVYSSSNWVYLRSTGLGSHVMGPWYLNSGHTTIFPNLPINTKTLFRIPRNPTIPTTKSTNGLGAIGYFVDGVAMYNSWDAYAWNGSAEANNVSGALWYRDAYVNEGATFDPGNAHQPQSGQYHYHANPPALRYLLGDNVSFNSSTDTYSEDTNHLHHSPILGWAEDGLPIYGPYGYSNPTNPASGVRRMVSGYVIRNGSNGTTNLSSTGRTTIPAWASRATGHSTTLSSAEYGPSVSTSYPLGRYMEDNDYLGDLGKTKGVDFDLDEYNSRFCVTPEFPNGTNVYFVAIAADGTPVFPYNIGRCYCGSPTGGSVTSVTETVTTNILAGPNSSLTLSSPTKPSSSTVTLVWASVEGGTYQVLCSTNPATGWTTNKTGIASQGINTQTNLTSTNTFAFYRVARTALATYDSVSGASGGSGILSVSPTSANHGTTFTLTINLDPSVSPPPQMAPVNSVTVGSYSGTSLTHVSQTQVTASITLPSNATTGAQTVTVVFPGPPGNPSQTVTYTLANGFTVN